MATLDGVIAADTTRLRLIDARPIGEAEIESKTRDKSLLCPLPTKLVYLVQ